MSEPLAPPPETQPLAATEEDRWGALARVTEQQQEAAQTAPRTEDDWDSLASFGVQQEHASRVSTLDALFKSQQFVDADAHGKILALAEKSGATADVVQANYLEFEKAREASGFDSERLVKEHKPLVDLLFEHPTMMPIVANTEELGLIGKVTSRLREAFGHYVATEAAKDARYGKASQDIADELRSQAAATGKQEEFNRLPFTTYKQWTPQAELEGAWQKMFGGGWRMGGTPGSGDLAAPEVAPPWWEKLKDSYGEQVQRSQLGTELTARILAGEDTWDIEKRIVDFRTRNAPKFYGHQGLLESTAMEAVNLLPAQTVAFGGAGLGGGIGAAIGAALPVPGGASIGWRLGAAAGGFLTSLQLEQGGAILDMLEKPMEDGKFMDRSVAVPMSTLYGALAAIVEVNAMGALARQWGPLGDMVVRGEKVAFRDALLKDFTFKHLLEDTGKRWLGGAYAEGREEAIQQLLQDSTAYVARNASTGRWDAPDVAGSLEGAAQVAWSTFIGTAFAGLGGTAAGAATQINLAGNQLRLDAEERSESKIGAIFDFIKGKTAKASPDFAAKLVAAESAAAGVPVSKLWVDTKRLLRLFQADDGTGAPVADWEAKALELGGEDFVTALKAAMVTGEKTPIDLRTFFARWATKPIAEELRNDITANPHYDTPNQKLEKQRANLEAAKLLAADLLKENTPVSGEAEGDLVAAVQEQGARSGASPAEVAKAAAFWRAMVRQYVSSWNDGKPKEQHVDANELFKVYALRLRAGLQTELTDDSAGTPRVAAPTAAPEVKGKTEEFKKWLEDHGHDPAQAAEHWGAWVDAKAGVQGYTVQAQVARQELADFEESLTGGGGLTPEGEALRAKLTAARDSADAQLAQAEATAEAMNQTGAPVIKLHSELVREERNLSAGAKEIADKVVQALEHATPEVGDEVLPGMPTGKHGQVERVDGVAQRDDDGNYFPQWKAKVRAWMEAQGATPAQIRAHLKAAEGQLRIFAALGAKELDLLPIGAGDATKKGKFGETGPLRGNIDPIYKISFDASALCVRRLEAAATADLVQRKLGRTLTASERLALVAMFQEAGKVAPCIYCYVESPRSKSGDFVARALDIAFGDKDIPSGWKPEAKEAARKAREEVVREGLTRDSINPNWFTDPNLVHSPTERAKMDAVREVFGFAMQQLQYAKANAPKLYEEYLGQVLDLPQEVISELNSYAGFRVFSSSDFQVEHIADLIQLFADLDRRGAKSHAYTKVRAFAEMFGSTGMKIQLSIFAKQVGGIGVGKGKKRRTVGGQIVEDSEQGMAWADAQELVKKYPNVGTVLVAADDEILRWGKKTEWIHYIIPFHYSGLEKKYYKEMNWDDFTSQQKEKVAQRVKVVEVGGKWQVADKVFDDLAQATRYSKKLAKAGMVSPIAVLSPVTRRDLVRNAQVVESVSDKDVESAARAWMAEAKGATKEVEQLGPGEWRVVQTSAKGKKTYSVFDAKRVARELAKETNKAKQIRMHEIPDIARTGLDDLEAGKRYLTLCRERGLVPVFSRFLTADGSPLAKDFSNLDPGYFRLKKDYARTDTPFRATKLKGIDQKVVEREMKRLTSGEVVPASQVKGWKPGAKELEEFVVANTIPGSTHRFYVNLGSVALGARTEGKNVRLAILGAIAKAKEELERAAPGVPGLLTPVEHKVLLQEDRVAFREWFGDSQVVNEDGSPRVVYRGTGQNEGTQPGQWFTDSPETASGYATGRALEAEDESGVPGAPNVMPVYLSLQNPLVVDAKGETWEMIPYVTPKHREEAAKGESVWYPQDWPAHVDKGQHAEDIQTTWTTRQLVEEARRLGHDGLLIRNVNDQLDGGPQGEVLVPFRSTQIKSAIGNQGTYSRTNPNIHLQEDSAPSEFDARVVYQQDGWHGSAYPISKLDLSHVGEGAGGGRGWGVYFSGSERGGDLWRQILGGQAGTPGALHKASLPDADELLHWEAKTEDQPAGVRAAIEALGALPGQTGGEFYAALAQSLGSEKAASEALQSVDVPGSSYDRGSVRNSVIWDLSSIRSVERVRQDDKGKVVRGWMERLQDGVRTIFDLVLTEHVNASTLIHESSHIWLELMGDLAERPDAPERLRKDWADTLAWMGISTRAQLGSEHHERWARTFEAYLLAGTPPSASLAGAFSRFSRWLSSIYGGVSRVPGARLDPVISRIFDRMLASDRELEAMVDAQGMQPMFRSPEEAGKNPEEWKEYLDQQEAALSHVARQTEQTVLREQARANTEIWQEEEAKVREEVEAAYAAQPAALALAWLNRGEVGDSVTLAALPLMQRLSRASVEAALPEQEAALRKRLTGRVAKDGTLDFAQLAEAVGLPAADLGKAILALPARADWVKEQVEQRMAARHGDLALERDRLRELILDDQHAEPTVRWLLNELQAIRRKGMLAPGGATIESLEAAAELVVSRTQLVDLSHWRALQAERSAGRKAFEAAAKGDYAQALVHKQRQILNHLVFRASREAGKEQKQFERIAERLTDPKARGRLGLAAPELHELRDISDQLLEALGFMERPVATSGNANRATLADLERFLDALGLAPAFDVDLVAHMLTQPPTAPVGRKGNVREQHLGLDVGQMRAARDAFKQIAQVGLDLNQLRVKDRLYTRTQLIERIADEAALEVKDKGAPPAREQAKRGYKTYAAANGLNALLTDPQYMFELLGKTSEEFFWQGFQRASNFEAELQVDVTDAFTKLLERFTQGNAKRLAEPLPTDVLPFPAGFDRDIRYRDRLWLLLVAANMGTESSRQRLLDGYKWKEDEVLAALERHLTPADMEFVQAIWNLFDEKLWPAMAKVHEEVNGIEPGKLQRLGLTVHGKVYAGGYFPARYDPVSDSGTGNKQEDASAAQLYGVSSARTTVAKSFTKKREVKVVDQINLTSWSVVTQHVFDVTHYVAFEKYIRDAHGVLKDGRFRKVVRHHLGPKAENHLDGFLKAAATARGDELIPQLSELTTLVGAARSRFAMGILGGSISTALGDSVAPLFAWTSGEVGTSQIFQKLFWCNPVINPLGWSGLRGRVLSKSGYMRRRATRPAGKLRNLMASVGELGYKTRLSDLLEHIRHLAFLPFEAMERVTSTAVWLARYDGEKAKGATEEDAVAGADRAIQHTFPGHDIAEQSSLLRDKRGAGMVLAFFGFFNKAYTQMYRRVPHQAYQAWTQAEQVDEYATAAGKSVQAFGMVLGCLAVNMALSELMSGRGPDEDETVPEWMLRKMLAGLFLPLPLGGEVAGWIDWKLGPGGGRAPSERSAPVTSGIFRSMKALDDLANGDKEAFDRALAAFELVAYGANLPMLPVRRAVRYMHSPVDTSPPGVVSGLIWGERENQPANPITLFTKRGR